MVIHIMVVILDLIGDLTGDIIHHIIPGITGTLPIIGIHHIIGTHRIIGEDTIHIIPIILLIASLIITDLYPLLQKFTVGCVEV